MSARLLLRATRDGTIKVGGAVHTVNDSGNVYDRSVTFSAGNCRLFEEAFVLAQYLSVGPSCGITGKDIERIQDRNQNSKALVFCY